MPQDSDVPTAHGGGRGVELRDALVQRGEAGPPIRVSVVGADVRVRQRLVELLTGTPGLEVVGWADSAQALAVLGLSADACLAVEPASAPESGESEPETAAHLVRPQLSPRQRQVLAAYTSGNELLDVVARQLGMGGETLKTHLRRIRAKYREVGRQAPTRRDLYVRAVEDGVVPPPA